MSRRARVTPALLAAAVVVAAGVPAVVPAGARVVTDGGDGNGWDHADWGNAQITCS